MILLSPTEYCVMCMWMSKLENSIECGVLLCLWCRHFRRAFTRYKEKIWTGLIEWQGAGGGAGRQSGKHVYSPSRHTALTALPRISTDVCVLELETKVHEVFSAYLVLLLLLKVPPILFNIFSVIAKLQTSRRLVSSSFDSPISAWKGPPHISYLLLFNNHL